MITTNNREVAEVCDSLVWVGRRTGDSWYAHHRLAGNSRMTEFQGAILSVQLSRLEEQMARRTANAGLLDRLLSEIEGIEPLLPHPNTTVHAYHLYMFRYRPEAFAGWTREQFIGAVSAEGVPVGAGYGVPLYRQPAFDGLLESADELAARCPVSEQTCRDTVWIFQSVLLAEREAMEATAEAIAKVQRGARGRSAA